MINILATPSDNYAMPCGVMFYSACANNPRGSLHFFVVTDSDFSERSREQLQETIKPFGNIIDFVIVDQDVISRSTSVECSYYPRYVFYRLFAFKFLPKDIHRIIYLDCDCIIRHPLKELWSIDISSYGIAGVPDTLEGNISHYNRLQYPSQEGYFNAGVIYMNLDYWREHHVENNINDLLLHQHHMLKFHDQDVLNYIFHNSKKYLPIKYNAQSGFYYQPRFYSFEYQKYKDDFESGRLDPVILHLCGPQPWSKGCTHPLKEEFFKYQRQTLWKDVSLWKNRKSFSKRVFDALRRPLSKFGVSVIEDPYDRSLRLK
jgi:lipopolysaccharide biosynthesis glycosyltransferase